MSEKNIEVKIIPTGQELIIREGEAPKVYDPERLLLQGIISAPGDFAEKRKLMIDPLKTSVLADYTNRGIMLVIDDTSKFSTVVRGDLKIFPELHDLQINGKKTYSHRELLELIKFKGSYFKQKEKHTELITALKNFDAKVSQEFQNVNDFKGAQATKRVVEIKTNLGLEFEMAIPIFTGGEHMTFMVDINVDINNGGVVFWLESIALHDLITKGTEKIFDRELKRLSDFVIIKTW